MEECYDTMLVLSVYPVISQPSAAFREGNMSSLWSRDLDLSVAITNVNTVHDKDEVASSVNPPSLRRKAQRLTDTSSSSHRSSWALMAASAISGKLLKNLGMN